MAYSEVGNIQQKYLESMSTVRGYTWYFSNTPYNLHVVCVMSVATHMWVTSECGVIIRHARNYDEWCNSAFVLTTLPLSRSPIHNSSLSQPTPPLRNDDGNPHRTHHHHLFWLSRRTHYLCFRKIKVRKKCPRLQVLAAIKTSSLFLGHTMQYSFFYVVVNVY